MLTTVNALDVPYIANFIYEHPGELDLNLRGISIADPSLSYDFVQEDIPALRFAQVKCHPYIYPSPQFGVMLMHQVPIYYI